MSGIRGSVGLLLAFAIALTLGGCTASSESSATFATSALSASTARHTFREFHMGSEARIVIAGGDEHEARTAARAAFDRIAELERVLSDWSDESEVGRLAAQAVDGGGPFPVSSDLRRAIECAVSMATATDGRFDPTIGPLTRLWRDARANGRLPDDDSIAVARSAVDSTSLLLDATGITFARPHMRLDFGAIGKGLAADEALALLHERSAGAALVELGGDLTVGDAPPGELGWRVRVEAIDATIVIPPWSALATSGDRAQSIARGNDRLSHVVDPSEGLGVVGAPEITVLVEAPPAWRAPHARSASRALPEPHGTRGSGPNDRSCCFAGAQADALATALSVAPTMDRAWLIARFPNASALLITPDGVERLRRFPQAHDQESAPGAALAR